MTLFANISCSKLMADLRCGSKGLKIERPFYAYGDRFSSIAEVMGMGNTLTTLELHKGDYIVMTICSEVDGWDIELMLEGDYYREDYNGVMSFKFPVMTNFKDIEPTILKHVGSKVDVELLPKFLSAVQMSGGGVTKVKSLDLHIGKAGVGGVYWFRLDFTLGRVGCHDAVISVDYTKMIEDADYLYGSDDE